MNRRLVLPVLLALLGLAALPAAAPAAWFPASANPPVDGPSPDIDKLGGVDLARDGTGGDVRHVVRGWQSSAREAHAVFASDLQCANAFAHS